MMNNIGTLREIVAALLSMSDIDAVAAVMFANGKKPYEVAKINGELCQPNGQADTLVAKFRSDSVSARTYCRAIIRRFQPFAEIVCEILPGSGKWIQGLEHVEEGKGPGGKPHKFLTVAEADKRHKAKVKHNQFPIIAPAAQMLERSPERI